MKDLIVEQKRTARSQEQMDLRKRSFEERGTAVMRFEWYNWKVLSFCCHVALWTDGALVMNKQEEPIVIQ